ncbi:PAS domain-containing sensor histidine kinase [Shewanella sp. A14]
MSNEQYPFKSYGPQPQYDALFASHERYRMMFDNIPLAYMSMNENAVIIDFNHSFSNLIGYDYDEIHGKTFASLLYNNEDISYHINVTFPNFKRYGICRDHPWKLRHKLGQEMYVIVHGNVRYDNEGNFIQTHCLIVDVTEQHLAKKECEKAESKAQLILDVISEQVTFHDKEHHILWANKMARINQDEDVTNNTLGHESQPSFNSPVMRAFNNKQPAYGEKNSQGRTLTISAYPVLENNGELSGVVQVSRDITERRNLEKELLKLSTRERQRIGQDLHDGLGQELTGLSFLATALANQLVNEHEPLRELSEKIVDSIGRAKKRMHNVLQGLCHMPNGPDGLSRGLVNLQQSIQEVFGIKCIYNELGSVMIDDAMLASHLYNIGNESVNNAVKYSHCSKIEITLSQKHNLIILQIHDDGCGFNNAPKRNGAMGLKIMQYRASMIGGLLQVESDEEGSRITCQVPL